MKRYRNFFCALVATGATLCVCHGAAAVVIAPAPAPAVRRRRRRHRLRLLPLGQLEYLHMLL